MQLLLGGLNLFGYALECRHSPRATAQQVASFFGVTGTQAVYGGGRGRVFQVKGLFIEPDITTIRNDETRLESYADGIPRTLQVYHADGTGYFYSNVIYQAEYQPQGDPRPIWSTGNYCQCYQLVLHGLT